MNEMGLLSKTDMVQCVYHCMSRATQMNWVLSPTMKKPKLTPNPENSFYREPPKLQGYTLLPQGTLYTIQEILKKVDMVAYHEGNIHSSSTVAHKFNTSPWVPSSVIDLTKYPFHFLVLELP